MYTDSVGMGMPTTIAGQKPSLASDGAPQLGATVGVAQHSHQSAARAAAGPHRRALRRRAVRGVGQGCQVGATVQQVLAHLCVPPACCHLQRCQPVHTRALVLS